MRVGIGWDRHRLGVGRPCVLGGVRFVDCAEGPIGHSDGDVVCHAVIDALLGAAALGDIGTHFPDTDPTWKGADSLDLLARVGEEIHAAGYVVGNVDCTIIAERPAIAPRSREMAAAIADRLAVPASAVSVKGTRGEGCGPEGRAECITVMAVAAIENRR